MLRLPEPQRNSRLGGWALMESLPQRTATSGQRWSLAIMVAATLVAIAAVAFDIRLSSEVSLASGPITLPTTESTQRAAPETATAPTVTTQPTAINRPADDTAEFASISPDDPSPTPTEPTSPAQSEQPTSSATSPAEPTASTFADAEVSSTEASTPVLDDPASRIREYLELSPGAQLPVSFRYEVQEGDTASSIAAQFGLEEATVLFNNFDIYDPDQLSVGQLLLLPPIDGLVYIVQSGDTLDAVLLNFQADMEETLAWPANEISSPEQIYAGQPLLLVRGSASLAGGGSPSAYTGSPATSCAEPGFTIYLAYSGISTYFRAPRNNAFGYHTGVDFVAPRGELIGAAAAGQVVRKSWDPSWGNYLEIDHGCGYWTRYAHLDAFAVDEGQWVDAGAYIGTVGSTGDSTGAHLHFEIIINGEPVNPLAWLN